MIETIHGEAMLLSWKETHAGGATITLLLSDPSDLDKFRALTVAKGKVAGQRFMYALAEVGDDELPKGKPNEVIDVTGEGDPSKIGPLCLLACRWCVDPVFQEWVGAPPPNKSDPLGHGNSEADAKGFINGCCRIQSRKELDTNPEAAERFHKYVRIPYAAYFSERAT